MSYFQGLSGGKFPFVDLPNTPEQHYERVKYRFLNKKKEVLKSRETLIAALESDEDFVSFWKEYRETRPDSEKYLSSLTDATQPFESVEIFYKYDSFLRRKKLSDIPARERDKIQSEFDAIRPTLYQGFLEEEAIRLNCVVSEVRPIVSVLPLKEDDGESMLSLLPDDVFVKIMAHLETIEVFHLTQVSRKLREIVYRNSSMLTRAEHALTTHLLTFTNWMNPSNVVKGEQFRQWYHKSGWSLMKWCCNISQNLETLVVHKLFWPLEEFTHLLKQCPNLKHLHLTFPYIDKKCRTKIHLPKLETLIAEEANFRAGRKTVVDVFKNSRCLRVFKGKLTIGDITLFKATSQKLNAFASLTALELVSISPGVVSKLDTLEQLPLRYLCLGDAFKKIKRRVHPYKIFTDKGKDAFDRLLSKLTYLEVLVSLWDVDLDVSTIRIMAKKQRNLERALIRFRVASFDDEEGLQSGDGSDNIDDQVALASFEEVLLERDPVIELAAIQFIVNNVRSKKYLQDAKTGFSIYRASEKQDEALEKWSLSDPAMRRYLGIEF